jgi:hypothetical protein
LFLRRHWKCKSNEGRVFSAFTLGFGLYGELYCPGLQPSVSPAFKF